MKRIVSILSGPHASRKDAVMHEVQVSGGWPSMSDIRRYHRGWYVLDRSPDTVHTGNKKWRKRVKEYLRREQRGETFPYEDFPDSATAFTEYEGS